MTPGPLDSGSPESSEGRVAALEAALRRSLKVIEQLEGQITTPAAAPIAIVGMACRFPGGANDPESYWRLLESGADLSAEVPADRWASTGPRPRGYFLDRVPWGLDDRLFRLPPEEIRSLDPQQRLLLELAWEAFEDAGIPQPGFAGSRTGVFIGAEKADFARAGLWSGEAARITPYTATGIALSAAAGRLAYMFDLRGPCTALDAACASSLVALDQAVTALRRGACDMALAGAASLMLAPETFTALDRLGALSPEGRCKTFAAAADGYARGEGGAVLVLKTLAAAQAAGDHIHGVILGAAVRHGGRSNGLTAPNLASQELVIRAALEDASVAPDAVEVIEAHGTGTPLGDPIEMAALEAVFGTRRGEKLVVGSAKTNIGHLETAAGMAGVLKLLLCLRHETIARHLHLDQPSPHIPWDSLPMVVPTTPQPWPRRQGRRRIGGVSAFGFSGTVAHLVLAEAPDAPPPAPAALPERPWHVVTVSGRGEAALAANMAALAHAAPAASLPDLAFSANAGRTGFEHRAAAVVRSRAELAAAFAGDERDGLSLFRGLPLANPPRIAFAFTGQGSLRRGAGRGLYQAAPAFRAAIDRCAAVLDAQLGLPLQDLLFGPEREPDPLDDTALAQPALVAFEIAMAELWRSWGIQPELVVGHSIGEFAAAHFAGALPLEDALALVTARGRLVRDHAPTGAMAAVFAPWERVEALLRAAGLDTAEDVICAAFNAPACLTLAGAPAAMAQAMLALEAAGVGVRPLSVQHAFHTPLLRPVAAPFRAALAQARLAPPGLPFLSTVTGQRARPEDLATAEYWLRHLLQPVRFAQAASALAGAVECVVEIGPAPVLTGLARQAVAGSGGTPDWLPSLPSAGEEWPALLGSLARLHLSGAAVDWRGFDAGRPRRRIALPTYRFQRRHEEQAAGKPPAAAPEFSEVAAAFEAVTRLSRDMLREAMLRLGLFDALGDAPTIPDLQQRLGVVPAYSRLFAWVIAILARDEALTLAEGRVRPNAAPAASGPGAQAVAARHPSMAAMAHLLKLCLDAYPEVLRGQRNPVEVLFPGGSMEMVESVYQSGAISEHFNRLVAREVAAAVSAAGPGARVIEIGAGTGGTTRSVLPALTSLADRGLHYLCTDISAAFVRRQEVDFGATYPFTGFVTLDIERDVAAQGLAPGSFDIAVAANVLHATRSMAVTLREVARLLKPGGRLIINEVTQAHECVGLTFGLTPGWWLYEDPADRLPDAPVLDLAGWRRATAAAGFNSLDAFGLQGDDMDMPVQAVMVARREEAAATPELDLAGLIERITGITIDSGDGAINLFELGLDSLLLMQVKQGIQRDFGVDVEMGQFYAELSTPAKLAAFVAQRGGASVATPAAAPQATPPLAAPPPAPAAAVPAPIARPVADDALARVVEQQIDLMRRQLTLLGGQTAAAPPALPAALPQATAQAAAPAIPPPPPPAPRLTPTARPITPPSSPLGPRQRAFIDALVARYTARTARSKAYAASARPTLGDWIATIGFRPEIKEMIYPIVSVASEGSQIRDLDGNTYLDIAMGFGVGFFGHSPPFVMAAVRDRLERGFELATQSDLAAETARLVQELTGCERVVFSNTGTEAVMTAFRLARTVTGRRRVAHFKGAFHGFYDGVMAVGGGTQAVPMVPGITPAQVEDVLVLDYGSAASLAALDAAGPSLAGVMVEPVQSRNPDLQPREFLQELRRICDRHGIALIFDELVNGFRIHPGGAQAHFGVQADIVTYGKMIGGGMPISIIAGHARFLDAIDGGPWQFGDDSRPGITMTFFGGTFCRHPLSMAATHACLTYMKQQGPALQVRLNRRTADLAARLDAVFQAGGVPFRVAFFASQFQLRHAVPGGETFQSLELSLFFFLLLEKGIYTWERRVCFLSIAHSDVDLDRLVDATREAVAEMSAAGFFGEPPPGERLPKPAAALPAGGPGPLALSPGQRDLAFRAAQSSAASTGFAEPLLLDFDGHVDPDALQAALDAVIARHDALRLTQVEGETAIVAPAITLTLELRDLADLPAGEAAAEGTGWVAAFCRAPFDLAAGPLLRAGLLRLGANRARLVLVLHHLVADGWSAGIVLQEIATCYGAFRGGRMPSLPPAVPLAAYNAWYSQRLVARGARARRFWQERLHSVPALALPADSFRNARRSFRGARLRRVLGPEEAAALQALAKAQRCSSFSVLLATWAALLARLSGQSRFALALASAGHSAMGAERLVGHCAAMLPLPVELTTGEPFPALLARLQASLLALFEHGDLRPEDLAAEGLALPPVRVAFNQDRDPGGWDFAGAKAQIAPAPIGFVKYDLFLNIIETPDGLLIDLDHDAELFHSATAEALIDVYVGLLRARLSAPEAGSDELELPASVPTEAPAAPPVLAQILAQAAATPERPALIRDGELMRYAELEERLRRGLPIPVGRPWMRAFGRMDCDGAGPLPPKLLAAHVAAWIAAAGLAPGMLMRVSDGALNVAGLDAWAAALASGATLVIGEHGPEHADAVLLLPQEAKAWKGPAPRMLLLDDGTLLEAALADLAQRFTETMLLLVAQPAGCAVSLGVAPAPTSRADGWRRLGLRPFTALGTEIRDPAGRPVLPGARGELIIAGQRTGCKARRDTEGTFMLLGPGEGAEMLAVIRAHPAVKEAVAEANLEGLRLRVSVGESGITAAKLRRHLLRRLPADRLPVAFAVAATLPSQEKAVWESGLQAASAPSAATAKVTALFRSVLRQPTVAPDDDFFELGGDSLAAAQLINAIRAQLGAELSPTALFEARTPAALALRLSTPAKPAPIPLAPRNVPVPLSAAQRRLWFLDQLGQDGDAYVMGLALRVEGPLDAAALQAALQDVVDRHEPLRTRFPLAEDSPVQAIAAPGDTVIEMPQRGLTEAALPAALKTTPHFDLARDLPLRAALYRLAPQTHVLTLHVHHIAGDGWSLVPLARDLAAAYTARQAGQAPSFAALPAQYADVAAWMAGRDLAAQEDFWRQELTGMPAALELPFDLPRRHGRAPRPAGRAPIAIGAALTERLRDLAHEEGASLFMLLQAALATLLMRYGAGEDIPIAAPVANRRSAEAEALIGLFVNTLVLRNRLDGRPSFRQLLVRTRSAGLAALENQDLPFERLVEMLRAGRDSSHTPLAQVMLVLGLEETGALPLPGLRTKLASLPPQHAKFDLALLLEETEEGGLAGSLEYDASQFLPETAAQLARHLVALLQAAAAMPDEPVTRLPLLAPDERRALLAQAGAGEGPNTTINALLDAQAAATPHATALVAADGTTLSFAALHAAAERLAARLATRGIGRGARVAVVCPRTPELVTAILAVLKSGAAYVPIDPVYPAERIAFLLEDAAPAAVLTAGRAAEGLSHPALIRLDAADHDAVSAAPQAAAPEDAAYVIYTSGSTGRPKGAVLSHRAVVSYLVWAREAYRARAGRGAPINTSIAFDATVTSLFLPLISGTALHLVAEEDELEALAETLRRQRDFSLVKLTPAHLDILQQLIPAEELAGQAHCLVIGGEALSTAALRAWSRHAPATRLINEYGPTEATVGCIIHEVDATTQEDGNVPIGRPTGNARIYLLDAEMQPVPAGAIGEIWIGGAGVAEGYLNRPELTAERFLADPFVPSGARMYRSGDLARQRADGVLIYLGRADSQMKLRGHRIEPGEVEAALAALPGVAQAAVGLCKDAAGDAELVGFIVPMEGSAPEAAVLRAALKGVLPVAMVPSEIVALPRLPLSSNGKIDRAQLAALRTAAPPAGALAPTGTEEEALCAAFAAILELPRVGRDDDFFALGGHSLLAARLVNRLKPRFEGALSIGDFFDGPSPAGLAKRIAANRATARQADRPALQPLPDAADHPVSPNQRRLWIVDRFEPGGSSYDILGALALEGELDLTRLRDALAALTMRHESLRTEIVTVKGAPRQRVRTEIALPLMVEDLSTEPDPEAAARAWMAQEALRPIPLAAAPLWRAQLLQLGPLRTLLVLKLHHAITDGWSLGVLLRDFAAIWNGAAATLPALPVQPRDVAAWFEACLATPEAAADRAWWVEHLRGAEDRLDLPADHPRGRGTSGRGAQFACQLDAATVAGLSRIAAAAGTTLFPVQLALVALMLHRYTGRTDLVLGTVVAGREEAQLHDLAGFLANTLALRLSLEPDESSQTLIRRTAITVAEALRHAATPFDSVVEALGVQREPGRTPLFDVLVAREPALVVPALEGLRVSPASGPVLTRHFDLALYFRDTTEGIELAAEYDSDLFDAWRIEALCGHIANLAGAMAAAPTAPLGTLEMLQPAERHQLLHGLSGQRVEYPRDSSIVAQFRAAAERRPDAVAVRHASGAQMSYAALDAASNGVAASLAGAARGELIGIAAARGPALIAGILGILKAGAAYVPLDPDYPPARLAAMLDAAPIARVLADAAAAAKLPAEPIRHDLEAALQHPGALPAAEPGPLDLAYVMFTSGSTGTPKAVAVPHRAVLRLVLGTDYIRLGPEERLLQTGAISFDAATFEIWGMLLHGGMLLLAEPQELLDTAAVKRLIADHSVSTMWVTSSLFNFFMDCDATMFAPLRQLLVGGERLSPPHIAALRQKHPHLAIFNGYGPTENTTFSCVHLVTEVTGDRDIPIGRPIANSRVWILGPDDHPAPIGVPGEICVGGDGLAQGYLGQEALTDARFTPHPLIAGERIYRTGDQGCWLPDGSIAYFGRRDRQVKVRGIRIEIGEVEAALLALPGVVRAAVGPRERHGTTELLGWLVGPLPQALERLRALLHETLPAAMVPAHLMILDRLPIDPNGKLDHAALPQPETQEPASPKGRAPANALEETLARLFAEVLGRAHVGVEEGFFEAGGHSLLALRLIDRIREELDIAVEPRNLFAAPSIAGLAAQLLASMLDQRRGARAPAQPAPPALPPAEDYPASTTQRRLWFLHALGTVGSAYNILGAWRLRGRVDAAALTRAFATLITRHEALRTVMVERDGEPRQRLLPTLPPLSVEDVATAAEIDTACAAEAAHRFDLAGPLLRARLLRVSPDEAALIVNCHHMIADGWSMAVLQTELAIIYAAECAGHPANLPPALSFKEAAAWDATQRAAQAAAAQIWWRQALADLPEPLDLPTDHARPAQRHGRGAIMRLALPAALIQLSAARNASPFAGAVALVAALMYRLTGQEDMILGTPVANRDAPALRGVVGFLADTLPLRCRVDPASGFGALLERIGVGLHATLAQPALPFDELVALASGARDPARGPLFDVMVTLAEAPPTPDLIGLVVTPLPCPEAAVQFDLTFRFLQRPDGLELEIAYASDLFDAATVERMAGWLVQLTEAAIETPGLPIAQLALLTKAERRRLTQDFARSAALPVPGQSLVALFEAQVDSTPDRTAVVGDVALSYRELDGRANALAAELLAQGVARGDRVGLTLPSAAGLIISMLGILKAGAAYVPLDPAQPIARLRSMAKDAGCRILVGEAALGLPQVALPVEPHDKRPGLALEPLDLAYVIFTSGSTGRPKGVMVEHGAVANLTAGLHAAVHATLPQEAQVALIAAPIFDASVQQIFPALLRGDTLHPVGEAMKRDPAALLRFFAERAITLADGTPTLLDLLLDAGLDRAALPALRHLILGGETLRADALNRLRANPSLAELTIHNAYGPTESTVDATLFSLPPGIPVPDPVPIGAPLPGVETLVLDDAGVPAPLGVTGELWIAGAGLARGYAGGSVEDAARFAQHPLDSARRAYRSGDRACWQADGQLRYRGRRDAQLKVRGHRIEAAEVEAALLATLPGARQAAALVRGSGAEAVLVGWIGTDAAPEAEAVRAALRHRLPEWMLPGIIATRPALPLTPSGKIDRLALAAIPLTLPAAKEAPQGEMETAIAAIWAEVLGRDGLGRNDSFFTLGGHSLGVLRVLARIEQRLGLRIPVAAFYGAPTVAALAHAAATAEPARAMLPAQEVESGESFPLSPAQLRMWLIAELQPEALGYSMPAAFRLDGKLDVAVLSRAVTALHARHAALRSVFTMQAGEPQQRVLPPEAVTLVAEAVTDRAAATRIAAEEVARPFNLERGPLLRWRLLSVAADSHVLILSLHHIVGDGVSLAILAEELGQLYAAFAAGQADPLPAPRLSARDAVAAMIERADSAEAQAALAWWRDKYASPPPLLSLPTDAPRTDSPIGPGAACPVAIPDEIAIALRKAAAAAATTPFAVMLALLARLLQESTGDDDLVIGLPVAGRFHPELERQVGLFAETLPIRIKGIPSEPFAALLARASASLAGALAHDAAGFGALLEAIDPPILPGRTPFFDVMLAWGPAGAVPLSLTGLEVRPFDLPVAGAQFDLSFSVQEDGDALALTIIHRSDLHSEARVAAMGAALVALARRELIGAPDGTPDGSADGPEFAARLLHLWAEVLGRGGIDLDTPFVEAGGHSLKALRLISRMQAEFGHSLRLREVFRHPTVRTQAALLAAAAAAPMAPAPPAPAPAQKTEAMADVAPETAPLASAGQRRIWALAQLTGDPSVYAIASVLELEGEVDLPALSAAIKGLVERHEALRTVFTPTVDGLRQRILPAAAPSLRLRLLEAEQADRESLAFDLAEGPLFQAKLVRLAATQHRLEIVLHHAIGDGWSIGILARDLAALYAAARSGVPAALPAQHLQYREATQRQQTWLEGAGGEAARHWWHATLAGELAVLDLPADRARPALQSFHGALHAAHLEPAALAALRSLAAAHGTSLFATLVAAFHLVLHRYTGQDDIILGTPVAGRPEPELDDLVGLCANTLVLRTHCPADAPFAELLQRVHASLSGALEHQLYPFDRLVEELGVKRDPSRSPVFDVFVAMQDEPPVAPAFEGLDVRIAADTGGIAKFDLSLHLRAGEAGLDFWLEYNTDLFDAPRIARMAEHLTTVLLAAPQATTTPIGRIPLLTVAEAQAEATWSAIAPLPPSPATLTEAFAAWHARAPERIALRDRTRVLTYAELDAWANGIATALLGLGLARGDRVAAALPRGAALTAAMLGIWKAGLVYVPLDPAQPPLRRALLLEDGDCRAMLGEAQAALPTLAPESIAPRATPPAGALPGAADEDAYLLFTSGSTGTPKGVRIAHRNLAAFAAALPARFGMTEAETVLALTTISFDISLLELACPFAHGMAVAVADEDAVMDPAATLAWLRESGATVLQCTPSRLALLLREGGGLGALRLILVGGERLPPALAQALRGLRNAAGSPIAAFNVYGPTETTIWSSAEPISDGPVGIGHALPGEATLVLSPLGEAQPVGVPGEIVIAGAGVGPGYLNLPDLTQAQFAPLPDGTIGYRTGDRGARRADGGIDFLGRLDEQLKLHGFRIEPGEVEAALRLHPAVQAAVVVVRALRGQPELIGYVVAPALDLTGAGESALRTHLSAQLPRHMIPAALVALPHLPLLPSGKINRKALPEPAAATEEAAAAETADPMIAAVLRPWRHVLARSAAGPEDDFFQSGGHSLRAAELAGLLQAELRVPVGLRDLFLHPTPRQLAAELARRGGTTAPALIRTAEAADHPLSRAQRRLFALEAMQPGSTGYVISGAFTLDGPLDAAALSQALDAVVARHEVLRTAFRMLRDEPRQSVLPPPSGLLETEDLSALPDPNAAARAICAAVAEPPFDLAKAPLLRARLLRLGPTRHTLAFAVHHIIADGTALGLIIDDLEAAYGQARQGMAQLLPPAPFQFRDHAAREAALAQTAHFKASRNWWLERLAGKLPALDLPGARPRPARRGSAGGELPFRVDATTTAQLETLARGEGATPFMVLLAAGAALLHRLTGSNRMVLGSVSGNRDLPELASMVGCFVNPLPLAITLQPQASFVEAVREVRQVVLGALEHADYPFDALVRDLGAGADPSRTPLFDIGFSWNALPHVARRSFADCAMSSFAQPVPAAKYDLLLLAAPAPDGSGGIEGVLEYATDLFDAAMAEQFLRRLGTILTQIAARSDTSLDLLDLTTGGQDASPVTPPAIELQF